VHEVTDSILLLREHYNALAGESYRSEREQTMVDDSGTILEHGTAVETVATAGMPAHVRFVQQDADGTATTELWIDNEQSVM
jgi:hypothetical protein